MVGKLWLIGALGGMLICTQAMAGDGQEPGAQEDLDDSRSAAEDSYLSQELLVPVITHERDIVLYEITVATVDRTNAETDDEVHLEVWSGGAKVEDFNLDKAGYNDRERGRTDRYSKIPAQNIRDDRIDRYVLRTYGDDAWLPAKVVVMTRNRRGSTTSGSWFSGRQWLSTDTSDASGTAWPAYDLLRSKDRNKLDTVQKTQTTRDDKPEEVDGEQERQDDAKQ